VISRQKLELSLLATGVAVSRLAFRSHDLYDLDSVNFALAMARFDPRVHQPHPPGLLPLRLPGAPIESRRPRRKPRARLLSVLASIGPSF